VIYKKDIFSCHTFKQENMSLTIIKPNRFAEVAGGDIRFP
jgi:hypothetical protein